MLKIEEVISNTEVNLDFQHKVNVLLDDSGTGKTFMFRMLCAYCLENEIPHVYFNYQNAGFKTETFIEESRDKKYIFLDNADLYLSESLLEMLRELDAVILFSIKDLSLVSVREDTGIYSLQYDGRVLASIGGIC